MRESLGRLLDAGSRWLELVVQRPTGSVMNANRHLDNGLNRNYELLKGWGRLVDARVIVSTEISRFDKTLDVALVSRD